MSRRRAAQKESYFLTQSIKNITISKFINSLMYEGKRSVAEKIFYDAIENSAAKLSVEPLEAFSQIIDNVKPVMEVRSRRVGGATYQVPTNVSPHRSLALAIRWTIAAARKELVEQCMINYLQSL